MRTKISPVDQIFHHVEQRDQVILLMFAYNCPSRCATGEAWPSIMLSCVEGRDCQPVPSADLLDAPPKTECGSNIAYPYFVSFIFFCSFLVCFCVVNLLPSRKPLSLLLGHILKKTSVCFRVLKLN